MAGQAVERDPIVRADAPLTDKPAELVSGLVGIPPGYLGQDLVDVSDATGVVGVQMIGSREGFDDLLSEISRWQSN